MFERAVSDMAGYLRRAVYSDCERYRLQLDIELVPGGRGRRVVFCMLNPSTATEWRDDPTVRRCRSFARSWGGGLLTVVNLFDWRATDPKAMKRVAEPCSPANDGAILGAAVGADIVIAAWGAHGRHRERDVEVFRMLAVAGVQLQWLRDPRARDALDDPKHPLYLHSGCVPTPLAWWKP